MYKMPVHTTTVVDITEFKAKFPNHNTAARLVYRPRDCRLVYHTAERARITVQSVPVVAKKNWGLFE